jgi:hypothetical protein
LNATPDIRWAAASISVNVGSLSDGMSVPAFLRKFFNL